MEFQRISFKMSWRSFTRDIQPIEQKYAFLMKQRDNFVRLGKVSLSRHSILCLDQQQQQPRLFLYHLKNPGFNHLDLLYDVS